MWDFSYVFHISLFMHAHLEDHKACVTSVLHGTHKNIKQTLMINAHVSCIKYIIVP